MTIQQINAIPGEQLARMFDSMYTFYTRDDMKDIAAHIRRAIDVPTVCKEVVLHEWTLKMVAFIACTDAEYNSDDDIQMIVALMYKTMEQMKEWREIH